MVMVVSLLNSTMPCSKSLLWGYRRSFPRLRQMASTLSFLSPEYVRKRRRLEEGLVVSVSPPLLPLPPRHAGNISARLGGKRRLSSSSTVADNSPIEDPMPALSELKERLAEKATWRDDAKAWNPEACRETANAYDMFLRQALEEVSQGEKCDHSELNAEQLDLLSAEYVIDAFKTLLKCHYDPDVLSTHVRQWEKCLGKLKVTPLTDHLSLRLLTANGKAGNVGRTLSLLQLRKTRGYRPRRREFVFAITSLHAANWAQRRSRNIFMSDADQPAVDNPTRWLDAILLNMSERGYQLTTSLANRMLDCYSAGRTGKAAHHFYRVRRHRMTTEEASQIKSIDDMPRDLFYLPGTGYKYHPIRVKVEYHRQMPPFFKVPTQVRGKLVYSPRAGRDVLKLDYEHEPEYSVPLAAAFAFAESLQYGACGHEPIELNRASYAMLIKACVHRGALWRAMHLLDTTMPAAGIMPSTVCYNLVLSGLAVVGDVVMTQEYYDKMLQAGLKPDAYTVRAIVDGLLNVGDVQGAITVVQDFFNQHSVLPHYTTHTKILELCLGQNLIYEAKRYVYFIQQIWRWEPNKYHSEGFVRFMRATQRHPQLQRPALQKLFRYFGEELTDTDFLA